MASEITINPIVPDGDTYEGLFYAYGASGGYVMEQGLATIKLMPYETINKYDVTQALQVKFDVRVFNEKLGLYKDGSNATILTTSYNYNTMSFPSNSISLSAPEFRLGVNVSADVISVGKYYTLYSDFQTLLNAYFGFPQGFTSIFSLDSQISINGGVFDASAMIHLMNYSALSASGEYVNTMTGDITIDHINGLLRYACSENPFNNRTSQVPADGFMANDLIYVPTGTTVTLVANFANSDSSSNYITILPSALAQIQGQTGDFTNGDYSQVTTFNSASIVRVVKVPLLIRLVNQTTHSLYIPTERINANFRVTIEGLTSVLIDSSQNYYLSALDMSGLQHATADSIGVNSANLSVMSYSISNPDSYSLTANFQLSATMSQLNASPTALQHYNTPGEFINQIQNILTRSESQQSYMLNIQTASQQNPYTVFLEITALSGTVAETNVVVP